MWQANHVAALLNKLYPEIPTRIIGIKTDGDRILDKSLNKIGGKGLFVKELEHSLINEEADLAVHSLKDLPAKLVSEFELAAVLPREDASDAFLSNNFLTLESMPNGAIIGTSSVRRIAFLKKYYSGLETKLLRGNIDTRLNKLDSGEYDGIILATAGLKRLGLEHRITQKLAIDKFIPAIAQGALAIEILANNNELRQLLMPLNDNNTFVTVTVEREIGYYLGASCSVPIAVHAIITGSQIRVQAMLLDDIGVVCYFSEQTAAANECSQVAKLCVDDLLGQGAAVILDKYK